MKQRLFDHFGLNRPYRFPSILALLVMLALAITVGAAAFFLWMRTGFTWGAPRGLSWGTPRAWFFVYLATLILLGAGFSRWPKIAAVVLGLASVEVGLGFGSAALYEFRLIPSAGLFPNNYQEVRNDWHPLLQVRPRPTAPGKDQPTSFFVNSEHLRGPERTPQQLAGKTVVALFGGSTTLDYASPDGQSWPDRLEQLLGANRYVVINHGFAGYTTVEHLLQTAFYQDSFGVQPQCAVYYVGWNDLSVAHMPGLDSGYSNHLRRQVDAFKARRLDLPSLSISPVLKLLTRIAVSATDTVRPAQRGGIESAAPDERLEKFFLSHVSAISAINRQRGIRTLWVGQLMNLDELAKDRGTGWTLVPDKDTWAFIERLNGLLRSEADKVGDVYVDIPVRDFTPEDFVDVGHFSPAGSLKFATLVAPAVRKDCR